MPQVEKYVKLTKQDKDEEIRLLNFQEQVRSKEIKDELKGEKDKLKELDQKILRARIMLEVNIGKRKNSIKKE